MTDSDAVLVISGLAAAAGGGGPAGSTAATCAGREVNTRRSRWTAPCSLAPASCWRTGRRPSRHTAVKRRLCLVTRLALRGGSRCGKSARATEASRGGAGLPAQQACGRGGADRGALSGRHRGGGGAAPHSLLPGAQGRLRRRPRRPSHHCTCRCVSSQCGCACERACVLSGVAAVPNMTSNCIQCVSTTQHRPPPLTSPLQCILPCLPLRSSLTGYLISVCETTSFTRRFRYPCAAAST